MNLNALRRIIRGHVNFYKKDLMPLVFALSCYLMTPIAIFLISTFGFAGICILPIVFLLFLYVMTGFFFTVNIAVQLVESAYKRFVVNPLEQEECQQ